jgi:hypothetical protein
VGLWNLPADGYSYLYQLAVPLNTLFWGGCAFWTTRKVLLRYFSFPVTASATFVFFLTYPGSFTIIWFWANNHLQSLLVFNLMLLLAFRVEERRDTFRTWAALGAAAAAGALLRTEYALFALFPALLLLSQCFGRKPALAPQRQLEDANPAPASQSGSPDILPLSQKKQDFLPSPLAEKGPGVRGLLGFGPEKNAHTFWTCLLPKALACAAAFLVVFFPQLLVWRLMWGRWGQMVMNNPSETFHWSHPVLLQLLFSTRHGLFYWSPVMLPTLCGFAALLATRRPRTVLLSAATLLLALHYVYASWAIWWMGYSFGARGFIALAPSSPSAWAGSFSASPATLGSSPCSRPP